MAKKIPMEDVRDLWHDIPEKTWEGLKETAEERQGKTEGIEDSLVNQILHVASDMEQSSENFPSNPDELYRILNSER